MALEKDPRVDLHRIPRCKNARSHSLACGAYHLTIMNTSTFASSNCSSFTAYIESKTTFKNRRSIKRSTFVSLQKKYVPPPPPVAASIGEFVVVEDKFIQATESNNRFGVAARPRKQKKEFIPLSQRKMKTPHKKFSFNLRDYLLDDDFSPSSSQFNCRKVESPLEEPVDASPTDLLYEEPLDPESSDSEFDLLGVALNSTAHAVCQGPDNTPPREYDDSVEALTDLHLSIFTEKLTPLQVIHTMPVRPVNAELLYDCPTHGEVTLCHHTLKDIDVLTCATFEPLVAAYNIAVRGGMEHLCLLDPNGAEKFSHTQRTTYEFLCALGGFECRALTDSRPQVYFRWCAFKALSLFTKEFSVSFAEKILANEVSKVLPTICTPQTFVQDMWSHASAAILWLSELFSSCGSVASSFFNSVKVALVNMGTTILNGCGFEEVMRRAFSTALDDSFASIPKKILDFMTGDVMILAIKTIVRLLMGYSYETVAFELLWDRALISSLAGGGQFLLELILPSTVAQGETSVIVVVSALLLAIATTLTGITASYGDFSVVSKTINSAASLVTSADKLGLSNLINSLTNLLSGTTPQERDMARWALAFPNSVKLYEKHASIIAKDKPVTSDHTELAFLYSRHLLELSKFGDEKNRILNFLAPAIRYMESAGINPKNTTRCEPAFYLFTGPPGMGKSHMVSVLARRLAATLLREEQSTFKSHEDVIYYHPTNDAYYSAYRNQRIICFDDFGQSVDNASVANPEFRFLIDAVTTQPMALPMAAIVDKGTQCHAEFLIGATNIQFIANGNVDPNALKPYVQSVNSPDAIRRRIKYIIKPVLQEGYFVKDKQLHDPQGNVLTLDSQVDIGSLFDFEVYDKSDTFKISPSGARTWTWEQICQSAWRDFARAHNYSPTEEAYKPIDTHLAPIQLNESATASPISSSSGSSHYVSAIISDPNGKMEVEPQGFFDWFKKPAPPFNDHTRIVNFDDKVKIHDCMCHRRGDIALTDITHACMSAIDHSSIPTDHQDIYFSSFLPNTHNFDYEHLPRYARYSPNHKTDAFIVTRSQRSDHVVRTHDEFKRILQNCVPGELKELTLCFSFNFRGEVYTDENFTFIPVNLRSTIQHTEGYFDVHKFIAGIATLIVGSLFAKKAAHVVTNAFSRALAKAKSVIQVDGKSFLYSDEGEGSFTIVPQSYANHQVITLDNGRKKIAVTLANGTTRYYDFDTWVPRAHVQGPEDNVFVRMFKNRRMRDQQPVIANALWAVVSGDKLLGTLTAISETMAIAPLHVAISMDNNFSVVLKRDSTVIPLTPNAGGEVSFTYKAVQGDFAVIHFVVDRFPSIRLPNAREMKNRFCCKSSIPLTADVVFMHRLADGSLQQHPCALFPSTVDVGYVHNGNTYKHDKTQIRLTSYAGMMGACGGLYLHNGESNTESIIGYHVAYISRTSSSVCAVISHDKLEHVRSSVLTSSLASEFNQQTKGPLAITGFDSVKTPYTVLHPATGSRGYTKFSDETECGYALAPLSVAPNGSVPILNNFMKMKQGIDVCLQPQDFSPTIDFIVKRWREAYVPKEKSFSWRELTTSACGLPPVDKTAACGLPFNKFGSTKSVFFDPDTGEMKDEAVQFMDWFENALCPEDWLTRDLDDFEEIDCVCTGALKDEPRPIEKANSGKTRLFTVCPVQEFLMQRKYFLDLAVLMTESNLAVHSALGVNPDQYGEIHSMIKPGNKVGAGDFAGFDKSFKGKMKYAVAKTILMYYPNDGPTRQVDPNLPPLNRANFIRYKLLLRIFHFKVAYGEEVGQFLISHPSGSFLTTIINIICQTILWTEILIPFDPESDYQFLGDDSVVTGDAEKLPSAEYVTQRMSDLGFEITSDIKDQPFQWVNPWNGQIGTRSSYKFLSRYFAAMPDGSVYGLLDPERLLKMLHFSDKKKMVENFPLQVYSFLSEAKMWKIFGDEAVTRRCNKILEPICCNFVEKYMHSKPEIVMTVVTKFLVSNPDYAICTAVAQGGEEEVAETTFTADDPIVLDDMSSSSSHPHMEASIHHVETIFDRFVRVAQFSWVKTQTAGTSLFNATLPSKYFDLNFPAQAKLANFSALCGDVVVRVTISPSAYAQGLLMLSARPLGRLLSGEYEASGDPNIILDCSSGTTAEIVIPCILPQGFSFIEYYGSDNTRFDWVRVNLLVLSALFENGTAGVQVNVFVALRNVRIFNPTFTDFAVSPQSFGAVGDLIDYKSTSKILAKRAGDRAVTNSADVNKRLSTVASYIRTIGGVLTDTVVCFALGAKLAAAAGFSRPQSSGYTENTHINSFPGPHFCHGDTPAITLASYPGQKVVLPPGTFGCKHDELDIAKFCSRYGLMRKITWAVSNPSGTILGDWYANPCNFHASGAQAYLSPLAFVAARFQFFRGGLKYKFIVAKTRFQTGQIEIIWQLGVAEANLTSDSQAATCHRVVWDLQNSSSIEVTLPYCSMLPWCSVVPASDVTPLVPPLYSPTHSNGAVIVRVLNPLVNSEGTASSSVQICVFCCGDDDIQFAVPFKQPTFGSFPAPPGPSKSSEKEEEVICQGGDLYQEDEKDDAGTFPLARPTPLTLRGLTSCVGEAIPNMRLLFRKCLGRMLTRNFFEGLPTVWYVDHLYLYTYHSYINWFSMAFAYFSGGVRYHTKWNGAYTILAGNKAEIRYTYVRPTFGHRASLPFVSEDAPIIANDYNSFALTIDIPYQSVVPFMPIHSLVLASPNVDRPLISAQITQEYNTTGLVGTYIDYIGGADDFDMGWQIGIPPVSFDSTKTNIVFDWNGYS